ncbi:hypothetical protein EPN90_01000 [Patescibacteria group bacterium]|nr:MAG: hypothetical protein EPN90_01000 [Patescibacteria group bacterium]
MKKIAKLFACKLMLVISVVAIVGCGASAVSAPNAPMNAVSSETTVASDEPLPGTWRLEVVQNGKHMPFGYGTIPTIGMSKIRKSAPVSNVEPAAKPVVASR